MKVAFSTLTVLMVIEATLTAGEDKPNPTDRDMLQGTWKVLSETANGEKVAKEVLGNASATFSGETYISRGDKRTVQGSFVLKESAGPQQIDLVTTSVGGRVVALQGIYRLDGDRLVICMSGGGQHQIRPDEFKTVPGDNRSLVVFQRVPHSELTQDAAEDIKPKSVEGTWERQAKGENDKPVRIVKLHKSGKTTLTVYDDSNKVIHQHNSKYRLKESAEVNVFVYFDMEATAGQAKGRKRPGRTSYAYRIDGNTFYEFRGVLVNDPAEPAIVVWQRARSS